MEFLSTASRDQYQRRLVWSRTLLLDKGTVINPRKLTSGCFALVIHAS
jgi:hypothetical protein